VLRPERDLHAQSGTGAEVSGDEVFVWTRVPTAFEMINEIRLGTTARNIP
jgi:hypothetical protein